MPLARIQQNIIGHLKDLSLLSDQQTEELLKTPEVISGSELETILRKQFKLSDFQILIGRAYAFGLSPFNARNFQVDESTFKDLGREFCRE
jgi:hypothetical protein